MTDTIRPKIDAIAPSIVGVDGRTLSDVYNVLAAMALALDGRLDTIAQAVAPLDGRLDTIAQAVAPLDGRLDTIAQAVAPLDGRLDTIAQAVAPLDGRLDTSNGWLDALAAAIGAAPYGDLELGSVRGFLSNIQTTSGKISRAVGDTEPSEPYLAVRPYLSALLSGQSEARAEAQATGGILSGNILSLEAPLINIENALGPDSQIDQRLAALIADVGTEAEATRQTILDTSGSIRLDLVAVKDAVSGGASATVAEIITAKDQFLAAIDAQTADIETAIENGASATVAAIGTQTSELETAISNQTAALGAKLDTLDTLLDAAFAAQGVRHAALMDRLLNICLAVGGCDS